MFMSKEDKLQKVEMPPYRPFERPENGGVREVLEEQKPIKLRHKKD